MKSSREGLPGCLGSSEEPQRPEQKEQGRERRGEVRGHGSDCASFVKTAKQGTIYRWTDNEESHTVGYCTGRS